MGDTCHVCGQPLDDKNAVNCISCGRNIHFQSSDSPGDDCSHVLTRPNVCGLSFMCNPCFDRTSSSDSIA